MEYRISVQHYKGIFNLKFPQALAPSFHHIYPSNWARLKAVVILFKWVYGNSIIAICNEEIQNFSYQQIAQNLLLFR